VTHLMCIQNLRESAEYFDPRIVTAVLSVNRNGMEHTAIHLSGGLVVLTKEDPADIHCRIQAIITAMELP